MVALSLLAALAVRIVDTIEFLRSNYTISSVGTSDIVYLSPYFNLRDICTVASVKATIPIAASNIAIVDELST